MDTSKEASADPADQNVAAAAEVADATEATSTAAPDTPAAAEVTTAAASTEESTEAAAAEESPAPTTTTTTTNPIEAGSDENTSESQAQPSTVASAEGDVDEAADAEVDDDDDAAAFKDALDSVPAEEPASTPAEQMDVDADADAEQTTETTADKDEPKAASDEPDAEITEKMVVTEDEDANEEDKPAEDKDKAVALDDSELDQPEEVDMENVNDQTQTDRDKSVSEDPFDQLRQKVVSTTTEAATTEPDAVADKSSPNATLNNSGAEHHDDDDNGDDNEDATATADADDAADEDGAEEADADADVADADADGAGADEENGGANETTPGDSEAGGDDSAAADNEQLDDLEQGKGMDEELSLLPDAEREISDADKERALKAVVDASDKDKDADDDTDNAASSAAAQSSDAARDAAEANTTSDAAANQSGTDATTAVDADEISGAAADTAADDENAIRELPTISSQEQQCAECHVERLYRYQFVRDDKTEHLCSSECVAAFRTANPSYTLIVQRPEIHLIADTEQKCGECGEPKSCKYRLKRTSDDGELTEAYWCDDACLDKLIAAQPAVYTVRRVRHCIDEICETPEPQLCIQCTETKPCRFSFQQPLDEHAHFVCHDACLNLLMHEQPDRFRVKRRTVRVRDLPLRQGQGSATISTEADDAAAAAEPVKMVARSEEEAEAARVDREASFVRRCAQCFLELVSGTSNRTLQWETMDYCGETCLGLYQHMHGGQCTTCQRPVTMTSLGKYCVRFGFEVRQFCQATCLDTFKKGLKLCSLCQTDISADGGFLASVGGLFKDFCTPACMRRYDEVVNSKRKLQSGLCAVCNNADVMQVEVNVAGQTHRFCSSPCFSAFQFVNNINADKCAMCTKFFERKSQEAFTIYPHCLGATGQTSAAPLMYCSQVCQNIYIITQRKIVPCQWCKVKKYNFDMIQKAASASAVASGKCSANGVVVMCSLNCLTLCEVSLNAMSMKKQSCDQCASMAMPQYHLTMSDSSIRNFCTYQCVMSFQSQFSRTPLTLDGEVTAAGAAGAAVPVPAGLPKRIKMKAQQQQQQQQSIALKPAMKQPGAGGKPGQKQVQLPAMTPVGGALAKAAAAKAATNVGKGKLTAKAAHKLLAPKVPIISNVTSLANVSGMRTRKSAVVSMNPVVAIEPLPRPQNPVQYTRKSTIRAPSPQAPPPPPPRPLTPPPPEIKTQIVTMPPLPKRVHNMSTSCRPAQRSVGSAAKPTTATIGCQTDASLEKTIYIPIPVPIYIPQPMHMYSLPVPIPVPMPLPIPVPVFIPTTRNSAGGIMKEIRKIQDKMPTDPFEAELLMMAEMVAGDKKRNDSDSGSDDEAIDVPQHQQPQHQQSHYGAAGGGGSVVHSSGGGGAQAAQAGHNDGGVALGEDMLQMALKMAQDYDVPQVDLESAMTANTITPGAHPHLHFEGDINDPTALHQHQMMVMEHQRLQAAAAAAAAASVTTPQRGRKRGGAAAAARNARGGAQQQSPQVIQQSQQQQQQLLQTPSPKRARRLDGSAMITPVQQQLQLHQPEAPREPVEKADANMCLKFTFGVNAWKQWVMTKNAELEKSSIRRKPFNSELLQLTADELNYSLCLFVKEVRKPNGSEYAPDTIYYLVLGIQQYLYENGRIDNIFTDAYYEKFTDCLDDVAKKFSVLYNDSQYIVTRVEEEHLWECKQLGAHSPHVLLSTLMFFNTKHFNLTTVEEHMQLSFSHIMKHWKRNPNQVGAVKTPGSRNVLLRFYPPQAALDGNSRKKKVYEQQENEENPLKCPVKLYEFYLSKCPESVKTRNDVFYLQPERSCVPDSPVWYSTQALGKEALCKMLHRVKMVKEINIALLTS